jgi:hypothetical protein
MLDPQAVLDQASHGRAPATWRVFTKERGRVRGFLRGTSADPDPLLVITPDGVVEYIDSKKPAAVVDFGGLSRIRLRVSGSTFSDSIQVRLDVWLDLSYHDGRKSKWRSASFAGQYQTIQAFIEAFGAYQAFRDAGLDPR